MGAFILILLYSKVLMVLNDNIPQFCSLMVQACLTSASLILVAVKCFTCNTMLGATSSGKPYSLQRQKFSWDLLNTAGLLVSGNSRPRHFQGLGRLAFVVGYGP